MALVVFLNSCGQICNGVRNEEILNYADVLEVDSVIMIIAARG
ncbi:MAG: hypothetical protein K2K00_09805 [Muribaculaceae bacterium]|nr:hypothetical protein [Muribaculaceae bacterium]